MPILVINNYNIYLIFTYWLWINHNIFVFIFILLKVISGFKSINLSERIKIILILKSSIMMKCMIMIDGGQELF